MRKLITFFSAFLLAFTLVIPVQAEDGRVYYDGHAKGFVLLPGTKESPTNLFPDFQEVMPGDTLTQEIVLSSRARGVRAKIYLRSKGAQKGSEDLLSQMHLTVNQVGKGRRFNAPADRTAQLTDWVYLGSLRYGGKATLELELKVDPDMTNEFADSAGYIDWEFKVEEIPVMDDLPQTGDIFDLALWASIALVSLAALMLLLTRRKRT